MAEAGGRLRRRVFLSTEDPDAVAYFGALAPRWAAAWTDGPRKPDRTKSTLAYVAEVMISASRSCTLIKPMAWLRAWPLFRQRAGLSPRPSWTAHISHWCT